MQRPTVHRTVRRAGERVPQPGSASAHRSSHHGLGPRSAPGGGELAGSELARSIRLVCRTQAELTAAPLSLAPRPGTGQQAPSAPAP